MPTLFRAARVADADLTGWLEDAAVRVEGGLVDAVLAARELPTDAATTHHLHDLGEVSLLPGFVETHVHMHYPASLDYRDIARPERPTGPVLACPDPRVGDELTYPLPRVPPPSGRNRPGPGRPYDVDILPT